MVVFTAQLLKFGSKGEKTGWIYIDIPATLANELKPGTKQSFRVKGQLDNHPIKSVALLPMGDGDFIIPINAGMRRSLRKAEGATVRVAIEADDDPIPVSADLLDCLQDDPQALAFFDQLSKGHQKYFSDWVESAKTVETKASRIAKTVKGLSLGMTFGEMYRYFKAREQEI
ncbi:hypothetical protein GCM10023189_56220 [Nibrella saemangeumensis]|uniref:Bacteriocin-protection, YdeI or OmpD-Associated n=1 Tax=Nibrella saemangeumensis TaxID=1084526 RepID=A0ABP8NM35_9BACT